VLCRYSSQNLWSYQYSQGNTARGGSEQLRAAPSSAEQLRAFTSSSEHFRAFASVGDDRRRRLGFVQGDPTVPNSATSRVEGSPGVTNNSGVLPGTPGGRTRKLTRTAESHIAELDGVNHSNDDAKVEKASIHVGVKRCHPYKTRMLKEGVPGGVPHGGTLIYKIDDSYKTSVDTDVDTD
jgi:hypothetical protein